MKDRSFDFVDLKFLPPKPRTTGLTEIRGPYYEAFTMQQLKDLLDTWGYYIDGFKFAGGVQSLLPAQTVAVFTDLAHQYGVYVNTGGFIERIMVQDPSLVDSYLEETKALGFDVVEVSSGMFKRPEDFPLKKQVAIVKKIEKMGMKAKPEITIMSGVGGGIQEFGYQEKINAVKSVTELLDEARQFLDAGAKILMIESEGITEGIADPNQWRKDVIFALIENFGHEKLMFEVSPEDDEARKTFKWYLKEVSPDINLMMNSKNIVEFNAWRLRLWGDKTIWRGEEKNI